MQIGKKEILVIGDRVLIKPDTSEGRTKVGLYLPQTVVENQPVQSGRIVETGPGFPYPNIAAEASSEPWKQAEHRPIRYLPLQAEIGDYVLFLKKEAINVRYQGEDYYVVSQSAIMLIVRGEELESSEEFE